MTLYRPFRKRINSPCARKFTAGHGVVSFQPFPPWPINVRGVDDAHRLERLVLRPKRQPAFNGHKAPTSRSMRNPVASFWMSRRSTESVAREFGFRPSSQDPCGCPPDVDTQALMVCGSVRRSGVAGSSDCGVPIWRRRLSRWDYGIYGGLGRAQWSTLEWRYIVIISRRLCLIT